MDADSLSSLLAQREYLPAVGLVLVAVVGGLRTGLPKLVPWFGTTAGGHVIGFGASTLLHLGAAFQLNSGITPGLFASALGVGWASSGGWEAVRDLWTWNKERKKPPQVSDPNGLAKEAEKPAGPVLVPPPSDDTPTPGGDAA